MKANVTFLRALAQTPENLAETQGIFENQTGLTNGEGSVHLIFIGPVWGYVSEAAALLFVDESK